MADESDSAPAGGDPESRDRPRARRLEADPATAGGAVARPRCVPAADPGTTRRHRDPSGTRGGAVELRGGEPAVTAPSGRPSPIVIAFAGLTALAVAMGIGRLAFTPLLPILQAKQRPH